MDEIKKSPLLPQTVRIEGTSGNDSIHIQKVKNNTLHYSVNDKERSVPVAKGDTIEADLTQGGKDVFFVDKDVDLAKYDLFLRIRNGEDNDAIYAEDNAKLGSVDFDTGYGDDYVQLKHGVTAKSINGKMGPPDEHKDYNSGFYMSDLERIWSQFEGQYETKDRGTIERVFRTSPSLAGKLQFAKEDLYQKLDDLRKTKDIDSPTLEPWSRLDLSLYELDMKCLDAPTRREVEAYVEKHNAAVDTMNLALRNINGGKQGGE